jgi:hypothetical protein
VDAATTVGKTKDSEKVGLMAVSMAGWTAEYQTNRGDEFSGRRNRAGKLPHR